MVSLSVHLVRSTKTRLGLSHHARSTLCDQAANTNFDHGAPAMQHPVHVRLAVRTALALQHLAHVRLAVRASNYIDTPQLTQRTIKTGTSIHQPRPTSATRNNRPATLLRLDLPQLPATIVQLHFYDLTNTSYS